MPPKLHPFTIRIHRNQWRVRFSYIGARYDKPCGAPKTTPREEAHRKAAQVVAQLIAAIDRAHSSRRSHNPITRYERHLEDLSTGHAILCARYHQRLIDKFGEDRDLATLTREDIEDWRDWLLTQAPRHDRIAGTGLAPKTVREHINWLAAVYNFNTLPNPCVGVRRPTRSHAEAVAQLDYLTPDQLQRLFDITALYHPRFLNALTFFVYTGCRIGEVQGIRARDLNHRNHSVPVTGKGDKVRLLNLEGPLAPAWQALVDEIAQRPRADGYVFPRAKMWAQSNLFHICRNAFGCAWPMQKKRGEVASAVHVHPHMFRHTFASLALQYFEPRWDIALLAKFLGHADIATTYKTYAHWIAPIAPSGPTFTPAWDHAGTTNKKTG